MLKHRGPYMPNLTLVRPCVSPKKKKKNGTRPREEKGTHVWKTITFVGAKATQRKQAYLVTGLLAWS